MKLIMRTIKAEWCTGDNELETVADKAQQLLVIKNKKSDTARVIMVLNDDDYKELQGMI